MQGDLCYTGTAGALAYKKGGSALVFKTTGGDWATITFAWGSDGSDLDICAYWDGASSMKVGFNWNTSTAELVTSPYHILYSGDVKTPDSSEWCKIKMSPWSGNSNRTFKVHLNFYGYNANDYPAKTCVVIASQQNGSSLILNNVSCGTSAGSHASTNHPGVAITFDAKGFLSGLTRI